MFRKCHGFRRRYDSTKGRELDGLAEHPTLYGPCAAAPDMCSEPSQPNGADLFVCRELTACSFSQRIVYVRFFVWREHVRRSDNARRGRLKDLFTAVFPPLRLIAHARSYLAFQRLDLGDNGNKQGRKMYRHSFPDIGRGNVVVLMPVEIANIPDRPPR